MAIDWEDAELKATAMRIATVNVITLIKQVRTGKTASGRALHADTISDLKTVDGPAVRTAAQNAWNDLNAAMTP